MLTPIDYSHSVGAAGGRPPLRSLLLALLLLSASLVLACAPKTAVGGAAAIPGAQASNALPASNSPTSQTTLSRPCVGWPKRAAILFDQSSSTGQTRTEHPAVQQLDPLIDCSIRSGGELIVGSIRDTSNETLTRLLVSPGPVRPTPTPTTNNAVLDYDSAAAFEAELAAFNVREAAWQARVTVNVAQFRKLTAELLARRADATATALAEAVTRAYVALDEPTPFAWLENAERVLVLVTDGDQTASSRVVPMPARPTTVYAVNGDGRRVDLQHLSPIPFESFDRAVVSLTGGRDDQ